MNPEEARQPAAKPVQQGYTKKQFLESKLFTTRQKDVLNALLKEDGLYTIDQVNEQIKQFSERKAVY